jgi:hypothetical protein
MDVARVQQMTRSAVKSFCQESECRRNIDNKRRKVLKWSRMSKALDGHCHTKRTNTYGTSVKHLTSVQTKMSVIDYGVFKLQCLLDSSGKGFRSFPSFPSRTTSSSDVDELQLEANCLLSKMRPVSYFIMSNAAASSCGRFQATTMTTAATSSNGSPKTHYFLLLSFILHLHQHASSIITSKLLTHQLGSLSYHSLFPALTYSLPTVLRYQSPPTFIPPYSITYTIPLFSMCRTRLVVYRGCGHAKSYDKKRCSWFWLP